MAALFGKGILVQATCLYFALLSLLLIPQIQREVLFLHRLRWPLFSAYHSPEKYGFMPNAWRSFHIKTTDEVNIGATHVLPTSLHEQALDQLNKDMSIPFDAKVYDDALLSDKPTILFLHGNGGTRLLRERRDLARAVTEFLDYNFVMIDYRSFGDSDRVAPSEQGLVLDARAAWDWLTQIKGVKPSNIALMGHSLGTGVVSQLAAELAAELQDPRALILSSPYASLRSLMKTFRLFKVLPVLKPFESAQPLQKWLLGFLKTNYNTFEVLQESRCPLFIQHARDDRVIPIAHSRALFSKLSGLQPNSKAHFDDVASQPIFSGPTTSLSGYGTLQQLWTEEGRRVILLESAFGGHEEGLTSQMMLRFIKSTTE